MPKNQQYNTQKALAFAIAAFDENHGRVERVNQVGANQQITANRQLIQEGLDGQGKLVLDESYLDEAKNMLKYLEQVIILRNLVGQTSNSFLHNMVTLISRDTIGSRDLGLLAWAPKLVKDNQHKDSVNEVSKQYELNSRWVGKENDRVKFKFTAIDVRYSKNMGIWNVFGYNENNDLVSFWANREDKIVRSGLIQGRVNKHITDVFHGNACVTVLNYVKVLDK